MSQQPLPGRPALALAAVPGRRNYYRNYWKEAGYVEEMEAVEKALAARDRDSIPGLLSDRWLADTTLFGTASQVREGVEAWYEAGVKTPILVPSSAVGKQAQAFEEIFAIFEGK